MNARLEVAAPALHALTSTWGAGGPRTLMFQACLLTSYTMPSVCQLRNVCPHTLDVVAPSFPLSKSWSRHCCQVWGGRAETRCPWRAAADNDTKI